MLNANSILSLGLLGLASAAPLESRQVVSNYPPTAISKGFRLVANVTDPSTDLTPPINGQIFSGIHTGAALSEAVISEGDGRVFYQNGTAEELRYRSASTLSDGGTPPFPWGILVQAQEEASEAAVSINGGTGTKSVQLSQFPEPYSYLTGTAPGTFAVCPRLVPYYNQVFNVIRFAYDAFNEGTAQYESTVPEDCVAVRLLPECATLAELPEGSISSHEFAADSQCYEDVQSIDWSLYGP
jgi:hypothetical protein